MNPLIRSTLFLASLLGLASAISLDVGQYGPPSIGLALALALASTMSLAPSMPEFDAGLGRRALAVLAVIAIGVALLAPTRVPGILLFVGVAALSSGEQRPRVKRLGYAACASAALYLIGLGIAPLWDRIDWMQPRVTPLAATTALVLRLVGVEARTSTEGLYVDASWGATPVALDMFRAGGLLLLLVTVLHGVMTAAFEGVRGLWKRTVPLMAILCVYSVLRLVFLIIALDRMSPNMALFVVPASILVSFVPLLIVTLPWATHLCPSFALGAARTRLVWLAPATALCGVVLTSSALAYHDPGEPRSGTVLFDESHSQWEKADVPFDRENWGKESTYNYSELVDLLQRSFVTRRNVQEAITPELMKGVQVLVVKTPTQPYTRAEIAVIQDHVARGGGLWLIGDHTNLHGMSDIMNRIALPMGFEFKRDSTFDMLTGGTTFHHDEPLLHPISGLADGMAYQTSASFVTHDIGIDPIFIGRGLTSEYGDYGHPNFFGNMRTDIDDHQGVLLQGLATEYGRGRVVAFSDSTILSNFALFEVGVSEMTLSTVAYLSNSERLPEHWRTFVAAMGIALSCVALATSRARSTRLWPFFVPVLALCAVGTASSLAGLSRSMLHVPTPTQPYRTVCFVKDASSFENTNFLMEAQGNSEYRDNAFSISTFATWLARLGGVRPSYMPNIAAAVASHPDVLVVFEPQRVPDWSELSAVFGFVQHGGTILVVDDLRNARSSKATEWLEAFEIKPEVQEGASAVFEARGDKHLELTSESGSLAPLEAVADILDLERPSRGHPLGTTLTATSMVVRGGTPFVVAADGSVVGSYSRRGRGYAALYTLGYGLTNRALGGRYDPKPDATRLARYDAALDMARKVLGMTTQLAEISR